MKRKTWRSVDEEEKHTINLGTTYRMMSLAFGWTGERLAYSVSKVDTEPGAEGALVEPASKPWILQGRVDRLSEARAPNHQPRGQIQALAKTGSWKRTRPHGVNPVGRRDSRGKQQIRQSTIQCNAVPLFTHRHTHILSSTYIHIQQALKQSTWQFFQC